MIGNKIYTGKIFNEPLLDSVELPVLNFKKLVDPANYIPDEGLVDAVNVALMLRQPLLLTGEPGTGKTQLAYSIARELGLDKPLLFETKSTSVSRDLFYTYDNLRRFQAAQNATVNLDPRAFINFNALGLAILRTHNWQEISQVATDELSQTSPRRSIVLIDEIDKAPRDFPNDILNELENLYFRIPELGGVKLKTNPALRPIVILTSNSEKSLPEPFLRRCIFYNIPFPDEDRLEQIVLARIVGLNDDRNGALSSLLEFFSILRQDAAGLRKKPGTAELLNWTMALVGYGIDPNKSLKSQPNYAIKTLSTLAKHPEDRNKVIESFKAWVHE